ncbi:hypothetical protein [Paraferrimonas sedimenticola]|uniref:Uncharacterized protein n=1 Tax=Paraferrimonas sedimenticola TaxID=375674 RepID=A0AA37RVS6_9GAMM|nr:hypothetical protein [Paraferrimonas sedimenticola]GLP96216.1 hypothetical protein GCM10007895_15220 [Paraferrimonas sedimenticola]
MTRTAFSVSLCFIAGLSYVTILSMSDGPTYAAVGAPLLLLTFGSIMVTLYFRGVEVGVNSMLNTALAIVGPFFAYIGILFGMTILLVDLSIFLTCVYASVLMWLPSKSLKH